MRTTGTMAAQLGVQDACDCWKPAASAGMTAWVGRWLQPRALAGVATAVALGLMAGPALAEEAAKEDAPLKPDLAAGQETVEDVCAACHGADGNSTISANPKLAGQHAEYIRKQLQDFTPPEDGKPARRASAVMGAFASSLEPQDIVNVAAYFAAQKLTAPAAASNAELVELGQSIYRGGIAAKGVPACAACHGPAGDGMPAQYPQLRGQFAEYTTAQLVAFRDGARKNNHPMAEIALRMTDPEIKAVADYIAGLRPEGGTPEAKPADAPKPEADKKDEANKEADE